MGSVFGKIDVENPNYKVISKNDDYEIREYPSSVAIQTTLKNNDDSPAFSALAQYIGVGSTPQNKGKKSIAMTAPVVTNNTNNQNQPQPQPQPISMTAPVITSNFDTNSDEKEEKKLDVSNKSDKYENIGTMQFILPKEYTILNAPEPINSNLKLIERPKSLWAVLTYTGWWDQNDAKKQSTEFIKLLELNKLLLYKPIKWEWYRYNPPWTIPAFRTNEIAVKLDMIKYYQNNPIKSQKEAQQNKNENENQSNDDKNTKENQSDN